MSERIKIDPEEVAIDGAWVRPFGEDGFLRSADIAIEAYLPTDDAPVRIGTARAIYAYDAVGQELFWDADSQEADAGVLAGTAVEIMEEHPELRSVLLLDRLRLEPPYRGNGLTRLIVEQTADLLGLDLDGTAVVLDPVPLDEEGDPMEPGPARDAAMARLAAAYRRAGFEPWPLPGGRTWWLPLAG